MPEEEEIFVLTGWDHCPRRIRTSVVCNPIQDAVRNLARAGPRVHMALDADAILRQDRVGIAGGAAPRVLFEEGIPNEADVAV